MLKQLLIPLCFLLVSPFLWAKTHYQLTISEPSHHLGDVKITFAKTDAPYVDVKLPAWRTGRYDILELANGVRHFQATDRQGKPLTWQKIDKSTWRVTTVTPTELNVRYQVYANELGLRARHIDDSHAFIDASGFFMFTDASRNQAVTVSLTVPKAWRSFSGMAYGKNKHTFKAANYDVLVDSPIETGINQWFEFSVDGRDYGLVIWGEGNYNSKDMLRDLKKLVKTGEYIWDDYPYQRYVFMVHATSGAKGATEHLNSTIIQRHRDSFAKREDYLGFIGTAAHEFIHTWNVKAYRPQGLVPYDYLHPNYSPLLWLSEGSTSYLEDHLLLRSGIMTQKEFFKDLAKRINRHLTTPGREVQSASETSFDKWINQGGDHGRNFSTNIYSEGSLLSMLLDLKLLEESNGKVSYRDVHKQLYNQYKLPKGFTEQDVQRILKEISNKDYRAWWLKNVNAPLNIDFDALLAKVGLEYVLPKKAKPQAKLDATGKLNNGLFTLNHVRRGGAAWQAGLTSGDIIVAINNKRISKDINTLLAQFNGGDKVTVSYFRRDALTQTTATLTKGYDKEKVVQLMKNPTAKQQALFEAWLGVKPNLKTAK